MAVIPGASLVILPHWVKGSVVDERDIIAKRRDLFLIKPHGQVGGINLRATLFATSKM